LQAGGAQEALKPAAALSIVVYTLGLPTAFLTILIRHRDAIYADQTLRVANEGESEATNPNFHIRRRYQELYRCGRGAGFDVTSQLPVVEVWVASFLLLQHVPAGAVLVAPGPYPAQILRGGSGPHAVLQAPVPGVVSGNAGSGLQILGRAE
jgi:hypothetical protein